VMAVLRCEVELVIMALAAAEFGATVGQHARQPDAVLVIKRHHPVVEDLGRGDRGLAVIQLGKGDLGIGVDEGLLKDPPDALQGADIKRVLRPAIAGALALELAVRSLSALAFSRAASCASVNRMPSCAAFASSAFRRSFIDVRSWR